MQICSLSPEPKCHLGPKSNIFNSGGGGVSQLFQSFPTEVVQNDSEWPILAATFAIHQSSAEWLISPIL